eukprot:COSAG01_NODE_9032_length_2576_cov_6.898668_5_plen_125_part_00
MYSGQILDRFWIHSGDILDTFWIILYSGYILAPRVPFSCVCVCTGGVGVRITDTHWPAGRVCACMPGQVLFNASIRDNIAYGVDVSDEEVIQALKDAKIWDFVEKEPDQLLAVRLMISRDQNRR